MPVKWRVEIFHPNVVQVIDADSLHEAKEIVEEQAKKPLFRRAQIWENRLVQESTRNGKAFCFVCDGDD